MYFEPLGYTSTQIYDGNALRAGNVIDGPAIVERMGDNVVIPPDYRAVVDRYLTMQLASLSEGDTATEVGSERMGVTS